MRVLCASCVWVGRGSWGAVVQRLTEEGHTLVVFTRGSNFPVAVSHLPRHCRRPGCGHRGRRSTSREGRPR